VDAHLNWGEEQCKPRKKVERRKSSTRGGGKKKLTCQKRGGGRVFVHNKGKQKRGGKINQKEDANRRFSEEGKDRENVEKRRKGLKGQTGGGLER